MAEEAALDRQGLLWGFLSYVLWGFFPIYWKLLAHVPALEILAHRMFWAFVFYALIFLAFNPRQLKALFRQSQRNWLLSAGAAVLLTVNWGLYIYAVNSGHILESSLAYFINPILNVAVGVMFFREPFPLILKLSVFCAAIGVMAKLALAPSHLWVSLVLAVSFCIYGITKKVMKLPAMTSSVLEGLICVFPAVLAIIYFQTHHVESHSPNTWLLLAMGGVVTGLPLFLFSFAAQRVPYSILGMLQFIAPTLQFSVGVFMFGEAFNIRDGIGFGFIWLGILFYIAFQTLRRRTARRKIDATAH
jgi:chloramphenicol-sensitive protein RarD